MGDIKHIGGKDCLVDVPGHLRRLADEIERGDYPDECVGVVILDPREPFQVALFGVGSRTDDIYVFAGVMAKAAWVASMPINTEVVDE